MRLLFANNFYYLRGGAEKVFLDEMALLSEKGHDIALFTRNFSGNLPSEHSKFFASPIEYEDVSLTVKLSSAFKMIYSFETKRKFLELIDFFKPDIIHGHNIYGRLTTSVIDAARKRRVPFILTLHDYKLICTSYLMLNKGRVCERCISGSTINCILTRCHKNSLAASSVYTVESLFNNFFRKHDTVNYFICPSRFLIKKHSEAGWPEDKLIHIPNFVRASDFEPEYSNEGYILFAGRLSKEKGVLTLLDAVEGLDVILKIVGDGPMRAEYEKHVLNNNISNVVFEGYKSGKELKALFRGSSFIVMPSEWYENAPISILEAFAYGKPVIGSEIGGIPEMVIEGETGMLFDPGDTEGLREKITSLLSSPSKVKNMGRNARKMVVNNHNAEEHFKSIMKVYEKVLSA